MSVALRPGGGADDDLQQIDHLKVLAGDKAYVASTGDLSTGVFDLPRSERLWSGRGEPRLSAEGLLRIVDWDGGTLILFDADLRVSQRSLSSEEPSRMVQIPELGWDSSLLLSHDGFEATARTVGPWVFPREACF